MVNLLLSMIQVSLIISIHLSELLLRTDSFASGSYMITSGVWETIKSLWTLQLWMPWIQSDAVRQGRSCIRPEISRVVTFDEAGINSHRSYYLNSIISSFNWQKQKDTVLNKEYIDFSSLDLSFLVKVRCMRGTKWIGRV